MVRKVKDATGNTISHVFDTISEKDTQSTAISVLTEHKPGKFLSDLSLAEGIQDHRKDVQVASPSLALLETIRWAV